MTAQQRPLPAFVIRHGYQRSLVGCLAAFVLASQLAQAAQAPTEDSLWYYEIGGAEPVSAPANPSVVSVTLGGSAQVGLGYSCGKFDPVAAVTHTLNDIGSGVDNMMNAMTAAASSAIAALPALILQRANPGLYGLFYNALLKAEKVMQLATKSCEQMEAEIAQGKNPYADLITLSKGNDWKLQMGIGGNDAVTAKEAVETSNGENGVPWIGGQSGGVGQPELRFTGDIVQAGYNITLNRPVAATSAVGSSSARLAAIWNRPSEARDWTIEVVGENIVTTCDTCRKESIPGMGLLPKLHQESTIVTTAMQKLGLDMLEFGVRGFKGGRQMEDSLDEMRQAIEEAAQQPPEPPPPGRFRTNAGSGPNRCPRHPRLSGKPRLCGIRRSPRRRDSPDGAQLWLAGGPQRDGDRRRWASGTGPGQP